MARQKPVLTTYPLELLSEIDSLAEELAEITYQRPNRNGTVILLLSEALEARRDKESKDS